jgi:acyl-CoA synthetase (AMP-forming)/AMP-acid ligase II
VQTLTACALRWAQERPDTPAVVFLCAGDEQTITYGAFFAHAAGAAHALREAGISPGDLVVLVGEHNPAVLYHFWGALLLGAIPSIFPFLSDKLDPERYFDSVRELVSRSGVRAVLAAPAFHTRLAEVLDVPLLPLLVNSISEAALKMNFQPAQQDSTAFLQHSSGSTGLQKGVMLSHRAVLNQIDSYSRAIALTEQDVIVSWLPLYHDMGLIAGFIMPLVAGVKLVLMSPFEWVRQPAMLLQAIHRYRGTLCWLPNFAYNFLAQRVRDHALNDLDLSSLRAVINCSEPVYAESHRLFVERYHAYGLRETALATCYAMAENVFAVTQSQLGAVPREDRVQATALLGERRAIPDENGTLNFVSCGTPIAGCDVQIVDGHGVPLPERHVGEIILRSNSMLKGYYRQPDVTASVLISGWYHTGDMGYIAERELYITGRRKDLIIIGGKNVYPQDIENLLNGIEGLHPGRAAAFGIPNRTTGTEDIAVAAEVETDSSDARADIMRAIRTRVAQTLDVAVRYVHLVEAKWLIKTSSGKIARAANRDKFINEVLKSETVSG